MKTVPFLLGILFFATVNAQITFEYSPPQTVYKFSTTSKGDKYFSLGDKDSSNVIINTMTIYNADWSIYRYLYIPNGYMYTDFAQGNQPAVGTSGYSPTVRSISDELFNSDTLLEFLSYNYFIGASTYYKFQVVNELGQVIFAFPDSTVGSGVELYEINGNFKMSYIAYNTGNPEVYALPGTLPCNLCSNYTTAVVSPQNQGTIRMDAYPNPFANTLVVDYDISPQPEGQLTLTTVDGKVVSTLRLTQSANKLELNTGNLPKGIIIASIYDDNQQLMSKKLVKIE